jgi:hypothetical protein
VAGSKRKGAGARLDRLIRDYVRFWHKADDPLQKFGEEFQRVGKDGVDAAVSSFGEVNKGLQAIAAEFTAYSKKTFEDGTRAFEQLLSAKSFEQVIEIQSQYARMVYEARCRVVEAR